MPEIFNKTLPINLEKALWFCLCARGFMETFPVDRGPSVVDFFFVVFLFSVFLGTRIHKELV